jgi:hypothetical protein
MSGGDGSKTDISPSTYTQAGEKVATFLERAAIPGKPPLAVPGPSPADAAATGLATTIGTHITSASTEMAPRGPLMRTASGAAATEIQAQDIAAGQKIEGVAKPTAPDWSYNDVAGATAAGIKAEAKAAVDYNTKQLRNIVLDGAPPGIDGPLSKANLADNISTGKGLGLIGKVGGAAANVAEVFDGIKKGFAQVDGGAAPITAAIDQGAHTFGGILAGGVGAEGGAALGGMLGTALIPIPGVGTAIGAGFGALAGSLLASDAGKAAGDALAAGVHTFASAGSFTEAWSSVPGTLGTMGVNALDAIGADVTGMRSSSEAVAKNVLGWFSG